MLRIERGREDEARYWLEALRVNWAMMRVIESPKQDPVSRGLPFSLIAVTPRRSHPGPRFGMKRAGMRSPIFRSFPTRC